MSDLASTSAIIIKGGASVSSSSLFASLVIVNDSSYLYLGIIGALFSSFGVIHELNKAENRNKKYLKREIAVEIIKSLSLGFLAIPFWYLFIISGILSDMLNINLSGASKELSIIISIFLSWWTVPIWDWGTSFIRLKAKSMTNNLKKGDDNA